MLTSHGADGPSDRDRGPPKLCAIPSNAARDAWEADRGRGTELLGVTERLRVMRFVVLAPFNGLSIEDMVQPSSFADAPCRRDGGAIQLNAATDWMRSDAHYGHRRTGTEGG